MTMAAESFTQHPVCAVVRARAARKALWMRHEWANIPESPHPAAIQHEEVDRILSNPEETRSREERFYSEDEEAIRLADAVREAEGVLWREPRWSKLVDTFDLNALDLHLFATSTALALDPSLGRVFAYLHDQPEMTNATVWLAAALSGSDVTAGLGADSPLITWRLVGRTLETAQLPEALRGWVASSAAAAWLGDQGLDDLPVGARLIDTQHFAELPVLYPEAFSALSDFYAVGTQGSLAVEFEVVGALGCGRTTLAGQLAAAEGKSLLSVDGAALTSGASESEAADRAVEAVRAAALRDAVLYWDEGSESNAAIRRILHQYPGLRIVGRRSPQADLLPPGVLFRSVELPPLSRAAREKLWHHLSEQEPPRQVRDWMLTPSEIAKIVQVGAVSDEAVVQVCRRPAESLSLLLRMPLPYGEKDLVLASSVQVQLDEFEQQVRLRWEVYEDWGFERLCPNGRGIVALLSGPTGTGKTMAAQVLARKLGLELYRLDPAQVVNKFIGETEKRLKTVFDECDRAHFLLLIDECEGMFGQRFNSKDAHDRYANLEIDYLLQRLERFQGVALLATNRKSDLDTAFLRRIRFVIDFLNPGPEERGKLWRSAIPEKSPSGVQLRGEIDWDTLADKISLTGAEIKLAALNAAFLAYADNKSKIGMPHLVAAVRREFAKKGQTLRGLE